MRLVVGLGNPGDSYAHNRHNVGYMAIDEIIKFHQLPPLRVKKRPHGELIEGQVSDHKLVILKPLSFMNASGKPVGDTMRYFNLKPEDVIVFHDEIDLILGKIRVKIGGGHAGHNGLRDIEKHIGNGFSRVRLGVGRPPTAATVINHVLGNFSRSDRSLIQPVLEAASKHLPLLLNGNSSDFMSRVAAETREKTEEDY